MLRIGSMFSGYGGLDMGVQAVIGGQVAWHVEFDRNADKVLAARFPGVPNHGDAYRTDWAEVEPVDVLVGGPPCQGHSIAGLQQGHADPRNGWPAMARAVEALKPRLVVFENVRNILRTGFDAILADFAGMGFDAEWGVVAASDAGAPHRRQRLFCIAWPAADPGGGQLEGAEEQGGLPVAAEHGAGPPLLPTPRAVSHKTGTMATTRGMVARNGYKGRLEEALAVLPTPRASIGDASMTWWRDYLRRTGRDLPDLEEVVAQLPDPSLLPTPVVNDMGANKTVEEWEAWRERMRARHGNGNGHGNSLSIEARAAAGEPPLLGTPLAALGDGSGRRAATRREGRAPNPAELAQNPAQLGKYLPACLRWAATTGRVWPDPVEGDRLNPRFVEWMMGLPDGWVTGVDGVARSNQLKLLGNGVVPQQAAHAVRTILATAREPRQEALC